MPPKKRSCKRVIAKSKKQAVDETCITQASEDAPENNKSSDTGVASKKTRLQPLYLTSIQQDDVVSWFQEHEYLYDKGNADYKLTEKKNALWKEKAEELGVCDGPRLKSWMDSIRTQYGKLTKRPSGSGGRLSDRDKWILEKLSFLSKHIYRIPNRGGVDLIAKIRDKHPERILASQENDDDEEHEDDRVDSISPSSSSGTCKEPDMTKNKKSANKENTSVFLQRLEERIQQSTELKEKILEQIAEPADPKVAERRQWTQWFGTAISEIDDSLWTDFQAESLQLVNSFKARSKRVQQANNLQQYQHSDFDTARRLQTLNYSSCPGGYLPIWQQQYQPPPPSAMLPIPTTNMSRSYSATLSASSTSSSTGPGSNATDTTGPSFESATATRASSNTGGQTESFRNLIHFPSLSTMDSSCSSDIEI